MVYRKSFPVRVPENVKKKKKNEGEKWSPPGEIFAVIFFSTMSSFQIALRSDTHVISLDKKKRAAKGKKNISTSNNKYPTTGWEIQQQ